MESGAARGVDDSLAARYSDMVLDALYLLPGCFLITDPSLDGHPIVFASRGFLSAYGYSGEEVLGRNGRMFQGASTDRRAVLLIREAIRAEQDVEVSILNYAKDGSPRWILFHLFPVFSVDDGLVAHYVSVHIPIPRRKRRSAAARPPFAACRDEMRCGVRFSYRNLACKSIEAADALPEAEVPLPEAGQEEKETASSAASSILSVLIRYSEINERRVSGKRSFTVAPVSSSLMLSLGTIKQSFVLTDPHSPDMPIVYASDLFLSLTGYSRSEVLGRNCRFLNGPDTDVSVLHQLKASLTAHQACKVRLLNYRKDGSTFWNLLRVSPVNNAMGKIAFFVGVQIDEGYRKDGQQFSPELQQMGAIAAVKVAVRGVTAILGSSSQSASQK